MTFGFGQLDSIIDQIKEKLQWKSDLYNELDGSYVFAEVKGM